MSISGDRPDVHIRGEFEFLQIYRNYLQLTNRDDFVKVFPDAAFIVEKEDMTFPSPAGDDRPVPAESLWTALWPAGALRHNQRSWNMPGRCNASMDLNRDLIVLHGEA